MEGMKCIENQTGSVEVIKSQMEGVAPGIIVKFIVYLNKTSTGIIGRFSINGDKHFKSCDRIGV